MKRFSSKLIRVYYRELAVAAVCFLIFAAVLIFARPVLVALSIHQAGKEEKRVSEIIKRDLSEVSEQRREIIDSGVFINPLERNNLLDILVVAQAEAKKRNADIIITDKDGFVLARSHMPGQRGDNIFQTTNHGREIAEGEIITAVVRGGRNPLVLVSGSYIKDKDKHLGALIVSHLLNDTYALNFKKENLKKGEQIVYYTSQDGIVGDSLEDKDKTRLISNYFSLGSDKGKEKLAQASQEIKIGDDHYIIRNLSFPVYGENNNGAFILFPVNHSFYAFHMAGSTVFLFLILFYICFFPWFIKCRRRRKLILLLFLVLIFFVIYFISLVRLDSTSIELRKTPYLIYNSTIKFTPDSDIISQSSEKTIAIQVLTGGESINSVSAVIKYDPLVAEVIDIQTTKTFCDPSLFLEKEINKEKGEITITCLSPSPGFSGAVGILAELLIQPLGTKPISLEFTDETRVLANDGLGTDVLRKVTNGYYQVINEKFAEADTPNTVSVYSPTHPNSNRWYKNNNLKLSWPGKPGVSYYYSLSKNSDPTKEGRIFVTKNNSLSASLNDGVYYFHIQPMDANSKLGTVSTFKVMIDASPPDKPVIKASAKTIKKGGVVRLYFTSSDKLSGLQSGFYAKTNGGTFFPVKPPFYAPFLNTGDYTIVVRVFDKADNFSESSINIHVTD